MVLVNSTAHGANTPVIYSNIYGDTNLKFQDLITSKQNHNKIRIVINQEGRDVYHYLTAPEFVAFCRKIILDSVYEDSELVYSERKGSPSTTSDNYIARIMGISVNNSQVTITLQSGIGEVLEDNSIKMLDAQNSATVTMSLSEFQGIAVVVDTYYSAKVLIEMQEKYVSTGQSVARKKSSTECS